MFLEIYIGPVRFGIKQILHTKSLNMQSSVRKNTITSPPPPRHPPEPQKNIYILIIVYKQNKFVRTSQKLFALRIRTFVLSLAQKRYRRTSEAEAKISHMVSQG